MKQGMLVGVLRDSRIGDCTNGGVTSGHDRFVLFGVDGPFSVDDDTPGLLLKEKAGGYMYAVPCDQDGNELDMPGVGPMMGGNFVYTSDSRFSRVNKYPIPVHDRWESQETYDLLSR